LGEGNAPVHRKLYDLVTDLIENDVDLNFAKKQFEATFIKEVLDRNGGNIGKTAKQLGMHRNTLSKRIRDLEIE
jgi:DNA-binding NtrC family response regulator